MRYTRPCDMPPELQEFLEGYIATYLPRNRPVGVWFDVDDLEEQRIWAEKQLDMLLLRSGEAGFDPVGQGELVFDSTCRRFGSGNKSGFAPSPTWMTFLIAAWGNFRCCGRVL